MRGTLAPALLFSALGLLLAPAQRAVWVLALLALGVPLLTLLLLPVHPSCPEAVFLGCWVAVAATAACVYLRGPIGPRWAVALAFNSGVWAGMVAAVSGAPVQTLRALPWLLLGVPASWLITRGMSIPAKVLSSWIIAVAALAVTLQLLPLTPGYLPDHLE